MATAIVIALAGRRTGARNSAAWFRPQQRSYGLNIADIKANSGSLYLFRFRLRSHCGCMRCISFTLGQWGRLVWINFKYLVALDCQVQCGEASIALCTRHAAVKLCLMTIINDVCNNLKWLEFAQSPIQRWNVNNGMQHAVLNEMKWSTNDDVSNIMKF